MGIIKLFVTLLVIVGVVGGSIIILNTHFLSTPSTQNATQINRTYGTFIGQVSNETGIAENNISSLTVNPNNPKNITSFYGQVISPPIKNNFVKYPFNNTFIYPTNQIVLLFYSAKVLNIPNGTVVPFMFYEEPLSLDSKGRALNGTVLAELPKVTINYKVFENGLNYTFVFDNQNNYPDNVSITNSQYLNSSFRVIQTFGFTYNNKFYIMLSQ